LNPDNLLSQLRDVHAPEPFGWWPLAPGWWIVIILGLILLLTLVYSCIRYWRARAWKREAHAEFKRVRQAYLEKPSATHLIALNQLLKRIICTVRGTRNYMHYAQEEWARELSNIQIKGKPVLQEQEIKLLSNDIYSSEQEKLDKSALDRFEQWIKKVS